MRFKEHTLGTVATLASIVLATALPAAAAPSAGMQYLVGTWNCTYHAGAMRMGYTAAYTSDLNGHALREIATWAGGGDEELISYDAPRGWTAVVLDDHGNATIMHATSKDPNHIAYSSVYPDRSIAVKFDRVTASQYTLHGTVRAGGKTITSVDTCMRRR